MAEVFVAKRVGPHGFYKRVALKRILPQYARDPDFVAMFINEARLVAHLEHPHIVQVFDFGDHNGTLFLAMELVEGTNVNRLLRACAARNQPVPLDVALHIVAQTARALAYAHMLADDEDKPLGIVHRDVSPANILVTQTGHVKLSDFGIARAAFFDGRTDDGRLRGKLGYMSPEQVLGRPLDGRSDVFTLSTVFAEMILAEPLFGQGTDLEILLRIRDVDLRPLESTARRIPNDVHRVLTFGLARDPDARPNAAAFAEAVEDVIRRRSATNGAQRTARLLVQLELVSPGPGEARPLEAGARPTSMVPIEGLASTIAETGQLLAELAVTSPAIYRVRLSSGEVVGPLSFPKLVELITTGVVDSRTLISKESADYTAAAALPELTRFVTTPALQWTPDEIAQVTWRGELRGAQLLSVVHQLSVDRETGVLLLNDGKRRKKIYLVDGRPEFIASTDRSELLGEFLVANGQCLRMEVEMALALLPRYGGRLGDALVGLGVLRPVELFRAISAQVRGRYLEAFRWRHGEWVYSRGVRSHEETFPLGHDPYELMRDAVVEAHIAEIESALSPVLEKVIVRGSEPIPLAAYRVPQGWERLLQSVNADATIAGVIARESAAGAADPEEVLRAFFLGLTCDLVRLAP